MVGVKSTCKMRLGSLLNAFSNCFCWLIFSGVLYAFDINFLISDVFDDILDEFKIVLSQANSGKQSIGSSHNNLQFKKINLFNWKKIEKI